MKEEQSKKKRNFIAASGIPSVQFVAKVQTLNRIAVPKEITQLLAIEKGNLLEVKVKKLEIKK